MQNKLISEENFGTLITNSIISNFLIRGLPSAQKEKFICQNELISPTKNNAPSSMASEPAILPKAVAKSLLAAALKDEHDSPSKGISYP